MKYSLVPVTQNAYSLIPSILLSKCASYDSIIIINDSIERRSLYVTISNSNLVTDKNPTSFIALPHT